MLKVAKGISHDTGEDTSLFSQYFDYMANTEPPKIYHRWCLISSVAALLGRSVWISHGHSRIFPTVYTMLIGPSGSRKSTAIKLSRGLMEQAGYEFFAADKTSKEKFLIDLEGKEVDEDPQSNGKSIYDKLTQESLWGGDSDLTDPRECFIVADEFNEFVGSSNMEFLTTLGNMWDWDSPTPFKQRLKNSKSVSIYQPTITILGGNTQENFARAFPPEAIGQGFFSRLLIIKGKKVERKYAWPRSPTEEDRQDLVNRLRLLRAGSSRGEISITVEAKTILESVYLEWKDIDDLRFESYSTRRFTYLLKLCIITAFIRGNTTIDVGDVIAANTVLVAAEMQMPAALGEYGRSKNSDTMNKIVKLLQETDHPMTIKEIYEHVMNDLDKVTQLGELLKALAYAGKAQLVDGHGWLARQKIGAIPDYVDWNTLTQEERDDIDV